MRNRVFSSLCSVFKASAGAEAAGRAQVQCDARVRACDPVAGFIAAQKRGRRSEAGTAVGRAPQQAPGLRPWPRMPVDDAMSEEGESNAEPMVEDVSVVDAEPLDGVPAFAQLCGLCSPCA